MRSDAFSEAEQVNGPVLQEHGRHTRGLMTRELFIAWRVLWFLIRRASRQHWQKRCESCGLESLNEAVRALICAGSCHTAAKRRRRNAEMTTRYRPTRCEFVSIAAPLQLSNL